MKALSWIQLSILRSKEALTRVTLLNLSSPRRTSVIPLRLETIKISKGSLFLIIYFLVQLMSMIQRFPPKNKESIKELVETFLPFPVWRPNILNVNLWIWCPKRGGSDSLRYAISWFNKRHCKGTFTIFFEFFLPMSHVVIKNTPPRTLLSPPSSPFQVFSMLLCCLARNAWSTFYCCDQVISER